MCPIKRVPQEGCISPCGRGPGLAQGKRALQPFASLPGPRISFWRIRKSLCRPLFLTGLFVILRIVTLSAAIPVAPECNSLPARRGRHATQRIRGDIPAMFRAGNAQTGTGPVLPDRADLPAR